MLTSLLKGTHEGHAPTLWTEWAWVFIEMLVTKSMKAAYMFKLPNLYLYNIPLSTGGHK